MITYVKGVKFNVEVRAVDKQFVGEITDCPGCPMGFGMNAISAQRQAEVRLESYIGAKDRSPHQLRVDKMMRLIGALRGEQKDGQRVPNGIIATMSEEGRKLRAALIYEECMELINEGLGIVVTPAGDTAGPNGFHEFTIMGPVNLTKLADGCFDSRVVITGTLSAFGIPDEGGQELVDENNLAKFGPGATVRADGKLLKAPDHKAPDLDAWLVSLLKEKP